MCSGRRRELFNDDSRQRGSRRVIPMLLTNGKEFGLLYILSYSKLPLSLAKIFAAEVVVAEKGSVFGQCLGPGGVDPQEVRGILLR